MSASPSTSPSLGRLAKLVLATGLGVMWSAPARAGEPATSPSAAAASGDAAVAPGNLDLLFMIDNSSSMTSMQQKLAAQIPAFITALEALPGGLPNIHIAVVSSDMGAPGDSSFAVGCTPTGDDGRFLVGATPQVISLGTGGVSGTGGTGTGGTGTGGTGTGGASGAFDGGTSGALDGGAGGSPGTGAACPALAAGATFISNVGGVANYTGDLSTLLGCMTALGETGCGFEHQLASVARALGADGSPMPSQNAGFLRPDAALAIVFLSNEDDCSAPTNTELYSLNVGGSSQQNIQNALGPIANYRCNSFGHLCVDSAAAGQACLIEPPLKPPADAQLVSGAPTVNFSQCESAESVGLLTPVKSLVDGIRALKADPDNQIIVGAIVAPTTPYTVQWVPAAGGQNTLPGELWPQVEHSCGPMGGDDVNPAATGTTSDGSFGDPSVRLTQFVQSFGGNGVTGSICDATYAGSVDGIVSRIGSRLYGVGDSPGSVDAGVAQLATCAGGIIAQPGDFGATDGLHDGCGCDVGGSGAGVLGLGVLAALLALAWRRRAAAR
ncbi:MAG TPA: vWA domain-containing protein [Polyangia bacterium]|nr:vWA domain-containing protein [Polyangia bacterium]